ncbi:hypothetical protein GLUCOINTEAF2_0200695 [Komagataeibacter intermedius AF2]|uniref:Uncharacterized protein n=3 Tax=Komagataeibacter intermedius TaxID=66229 RepID=A0A0N0MER9_9PROT|nr:hypothetical protein GLUCOINTEAF2_0200695 [Komagataeibacter intermedius AF2]
MGGMHPFPPAHARGITVGMMSARLRIVPVLAVLALMAALSGCADRDDPRMDRNARVAADHGNGGPQGDWGSLGGGWSGPGNMGW